jgi:prevent-host-death family protein
MKVVNIAEAKVHLSALVDEALEGEEIVVARRGEPLVRLVPVQAAEPVTRLGGRRGRGRVAADFDAPLDDFAAYER